MTFNIKLRLPR